MKPVFTPQQVLSIRELLDSGASAVRVCKVYADAGVDCNVETIRRIGRRETFKKIKSPADIDRMLAVPLLPITAEEQMAIDAGALRAMEAQKRRDQERMLEELEGKPAHARAPALAADTRADERAEDVTEEGCWHKRCPGGDLCPGLSSHWCMKNPTFKGA